VLLAGGYCAADLVRSPRPPDGGPLPPDRQLHPTAVCWCCCARGPTRAVPAPWRGGGSGARHGHATVVGLRRRPRNGAGKQPQPPAAGDGVGRESNPRPPYHQTPPGCQLARACGTCWAGLAARGRTGRRGRRARRGRRHRTACACSCSCAHIDTVRTYYVAVWFEVMDATGFDAVRRHACTYSTRGTMLLAYCTKRRCRCASRGTTPRTDVTTLPQFPASHCAAAVSKNPKSIEEITNK
jgi:hypothetical protein